MKKKFVDVLRIDANAEEIKELLACVKIAHELGFKNVNNYVNNQRYELRESLIRKLSDEFDSIELHNNRRQDKGNSNG